MDALKLFVKQLFKNFEKQPGWVPLLFLSYITVPAFHLLDHAAAVFRYHRLSEVPTEVVAVVLTYVFYLTGDALDKPVFKWIRAGKSDRFKSIPLHKATEDAQKALGVGDGIYSASMALTTAAEKQFPKSSIHIANETAKFIRSLVIPLVCFSGGYYLYRRQVAIPALLLLIAGGSTFAYLYLKLWHMCKLYHHVVVLKGKAEQFGQESLGGVRLFFWEGTFAGSAKMVPSLQSKHEMKVMVLTDLAGVCKKLSESSAITDEQRAKVRQFVEEFTSPSPLSGNHTPGARFEGQTLLIQMVRFLPEVLED